jgi:hypothetical protein
MIIHCHAQTRVLCAVISATLLSIMIVPFAAFKSDQLRLEQKKFAVQTNHAITSSISVRRHAIEPRLICDFRRHFERGYDGHHVSFETNLGQTDAHVRFLSRQANLTLFLTNKEAVFSFTQETNQSHTSEETRRIAISSLMTSRFLTYPSSARSSPTRTTLSMELVGTNPDVEIKGEEPLVAQSNYFIGNDPSNWHTHVPNYAKVRYHNLYSGVDLIYYASRGQFEFDLVLSPGADSNAIRFSASAPNGRLSARLDRNGDLILKIDGREVRLHAPVVYQTNARGAKDYIQGGYVLDAHGPIENRGIPIRFWVAPHDRTKSLVIDPTLGYSTFLGGSREDFANAIAVDGAGSVYVTGQTISIDFPLKNPYSSTCINCSMSNPGVFISKFTPDGSALVYSTYLGGTNSATQTGTGIAVDFSGSAYVTGYTQATDFPTTAGTYQTCLACPITQNAPFGNTDGFVTKLSPTGSQLVYSTYLGGSGGFSGDGGNAIVVDTAGSAYVTGITNSLDFPTTANAFQRTCVGCNTDGGVGFVTKLNPNGQKPLAYSTYLGGGDGSFTTGDSGSGIAIDSSGNAYITGTTASGSFPTTPGAFQQHPHTNEGPAPFVTKLKADGSVLIYSTLIGGTSFDDANAIAIDSQGNAYITGRADSSDFPTTAQAFQPNDPNPNGDCPFVTKLNSTGSSLVYSTFVGGTSPSTTEAGNAIAVDGKGDAYLVGRTGAPNFPTTPDALRTSCSGCASKAFVTVLNPSGQALIYSTYLGGSSVDLGNAIALDTSGNVYITGSTFSPDFPVTPGAFQTQCGGGCVLNDLNNPSTDAFVTKFLFNSTAIKKRRGQITSQ